MTTQVKKFDVVIVGAGMSGIACAIRLGFSGLKVALIEKHSVLGGLNSYFQRVKRNSLGEREGIRKFDVGLHALTNFSKKGERKKPLQKILRQLKIKYDDLLLKEQNFSMCKLGENELRFSNDRETLQKEIESKFPQELESFMRLVEFVENHQDLDLDKKGFKSTQDFLKKNFQSPELINLILFPLLCYGSAWENDMDLDQFSIMFRSVYLEGFARPLGGIRTIFKLLEDKLNMPNVEVFRKYKVESIESNKDGIFTRTAKVNFQSDELFSSIGLPETQKLLRNETQASPVGKLSFVEVQLIFKNSIKDKKIPTILFYGSQTDVKYEKPETLFDPRSAIICFPNSYEEYEVDEGIVRFTFMANYDLWAELGDKKYESQKLEIISYAKKLLHEIFPQTINEELLESDCFTPQTLEKFTGHFGGTVYGSPEKRRNGEIGIRGVKVIGTDQGFLGVTGSLLSGISMANNYIMKKVLK